MRARSALGALVIASLVGTVAPSFSAPAPKAGVVCKKAGVTQTYKGKVFTCKKSGKKLVWSKGKAIKQAAPIPVATPSPIPSPSASASPEPTPSATPTPIPSVTAEHTPSPTPTPTPTGPSQTITLDNLDPDWTSIVAYKNVASFQAKQKSPNVQRELILSPTVVDRPYKLYMQGLEEAERTFQSLFPNPKYNIIYFTELDSEWIDQTQRRLMGNYLINPSEQLQSNRLRQSGCNIGGFYLPNIIMFCVKTESELSSSITSRYGAAHAIAHEYFHLTQFTSPEFSVFPLLGTSPLSSRRFNSCWMDEGFATFYGFALGGYGIDRTGEMRLAFLNELTYPYDFRRNQRVGTLSNLLIQNDPAIITKLYKEVEKTLEQCPDTQNAYFLGELAAEALVATYGYESMKDFHSEAGKSGDSRGAFEKVFRITLEDFYIKMTPYIASQAMKFRRN
jgi:hypothetical protein